MKLGTLAREARRFKNVEEKGPRRKRQDSIHVVSFLVATRWNEISTLHSLYIKRCRVRRDLHTQATTTSLVTIKSIHVERVIAHPWSPADWWILAFDASAVSRSLPLKRRRKGRKKGKNEGSKLMWTKWKREIGRRKVGEGIVGMERSEESSGDGERCNWKAWNMIVLAAWKVRDASKLTNFAERVRKESRSRDRNGIPS